MQKIYLYGAGGHAKVILDILKSNGIAILEIFDDASFLKIKILSKRKKTVLLLD